MKEDESGSLIEPSLPNVPLSEMEPPHDETGKPWENNIHFLEFWNRYGKNEGMSNAKKGTIRRAYASWQKTCEKWRKENKITEPGPDGTEDQLFAQHVWRGYDSLSRDRRKLKSTREFVPELQMASTYLNQWGFEYRPQPESDNARSDAAIQRCHIAGCDAAATRKSFENKPICKTHELEEWKKEHAPDWYAKVNSLPPSMQKSANETTREWSRRVLLASSLGKQLEKVWSARSASSGTL